MYPLQMPAIGPPAFPAGIAVPPDPYDKGPIAATVPSAGACGLLPRKKLAARPGDSIAVKSATAGDLASVAKRTVASPRIAPAKFRSDPATAAAAVRACCCLRRVIRSARRLV